MVNCVISDEEEYISIVMVSQITRYRIQSLKGIMRKYNIRRKFVGHTVYYLREDIEKISKKTTRTYLPGCIDSLKAKSIKIPSKNLILYDYKDAAAYLGKEKTSIIHWIRSRKVSFYRWKYSNYFTFRQLTALNKNESIYKKAQFESDIFPKSILIRDSLIEASVLLSDLVFEKSSNIYHRNIVKSRKGQNNNNSTIDINSMERSFKSFESRMLRIIENEALAIRITDKLVSIEKVNKRKDIIMNGIKYLHILSADKRLPIKACKLHCNHNDKLKLVQINKKSYVKLSAINDYINPVLIPYNRKSKWNKVLNDYLLTDKGIQFLKNVLRTLIHVSNAVINYNDIEIFEKLLDDEIPYSLIPKYENLINSNIKDMMVWIKKIQNDNTLKNTIKIISK